MSVSPLPRVAAARLLRQVDEQLIHLLRGLEESDWLKPAVGDWRVRDVAVHLLDGALRRLSFQRDLHPPSTSARDLDDDRALIAYLNELNADWVNAAERLSPRLITDLLEHVGPQVADLLESLDPDGEAFFAVTWAGEASAKAWMDVAREFSERWHHQQQIREAVGAAWLDEPQYIDALLNTFIRALPRSYESVSAAPGTKVLIEILDRERLSWVLYRPEREWLLGQAPAGLDPDASIRLPAEIAWRLFSKGIEGSVARRSAIVQGDPRLTAPFFETVAVMA